MKNPAYLFYMSVAKMSPLSALMNIPPSHPTLLDDSYEKSFYI